MKIYDRVLATLQGRKPDRIPFISRMDFWYRGLSCQNKIPEPYRGMSLAQIHKAIGFGQEDWLSPCANKYRNMELVMSFEGQEILHEYEPEISFFPDLWGKVPVDRAGETTTEMITPAPITECTFEEAWFALEKGPLIWGGIPSYYLESQATEQEFQQHVEGLLELIRDRPIILGIGDAVMANNDIERVRWIAQRIEGSPT